MTRSLPRRLAALALVVLIVSSSVAAPVAGSTSFGGDTGVRQDWTTDFACGAVSGGAGALASTLGIAGVGGAVDAYCHYESAPEQTTSGATVGSVYQDGAEQASWSETINTQTNNSLKNLQTTLYAYGESEQNRVIENGTTSVSEVNLAVNQSVNDRVAKMQINQINAWNQQIQSIRNLLDARDSAGLNEGLVYVHSAGNQVGDHALGNSTEVIHNDNVTLVNGSVVSVMYLTAIRDNPSSMPYYKNNWTITSPASQINVPGHYYDGLTGLFVDAPSGSSDVRLLRGNSASSYPWASNWQTLQEKGQIAKTNLAATASWKVDAYQSGELDLANATSPLTLAQEYTTRYNETGNLAYARAAAASAGYAVPNLNNTSVMTVHDAETGYNYTGQLFSQHAPDNGSWVVGEQYDAREIDGVQVVATTGGSMHELDGNFTVTSLKNANGESLNATEIRQYQYQTSNASQYIELQQEINDLREEIANQTAGGGGPSGSGGGGGSIAVVGLLAVLAGGAVIYLQRNN